MRVHLVYVDYKGEKIVDRLGRLLSEITSWPYSDRPDPKAHLNYFLLYIDYVQRFSDWHKTPIAAYFSHFEPDTPYKKFWWEQGRELIDIKTVTAAQYGAMLPGRVVKVTPPVGPEFTIRERRRNKLPLIGVSGFVDRSGRKGERLVARLAAALEGRAEIVASGQGWPARKVNDSLAGLPGFYNSLDLYLCTSTIEGIPMPPLEALACGVPVVVPSGVGMLDELDNAYRFKAGEFESLVETVDQALSEAPNLDREKLRLSVSGYTPEAWAESHVQGFEAALSGQAAKRSGLVDAAFSTDRHGQRGVYYVAFGGPARKCALGAITSFKEYIPDVPVALVSDSPLGPEDVFVEQPDADIGGRLAKVRIYDLAPKDWTYIAYLDADTEVCAQTYFLWELVEDGWDWVICKNPARFHVASQMKRSDNADECEQTYRLLGTDQVIQLNGGVFCFQRNERTAAFFHAWEAEWRKFGKRDQAALLRSLWAHPLKTYVLGSEWNTVTRYDSPDRAAWLLHYPMTARRWRGVVDHPLTSPEAWKAVEAFERGGGR